MKRWDIYWADVPYEDEPETSKLRPVIIARDKITTVLVIHVTSHSAREYDRYDYEIQDWMDAGLAKPSTIRVSKIVQLAPGKLHEYIGRLSLDDIFAVQNLMDEYVKNRQR